MEPSVPIKVKNTFVQFDSPPAPESLRCVSSAPVGSEGVSEYEYSTVGECIANDKFPPPGLWDDSVPIKVKTTFVHFDVPPTLESFRRVRSAPAGSVDCADFTDDDQTEEEHFPIAGSMANNQIVEECMANDQFPPLGLWDHFGQQRQHLGSDSPMAEMAGVGNWPWAPMLQTHIGLTGMNSYYTPWMGFYPPLQVEVGSYLTDKVVLSNVCAFARSPHGCEHLKLMIKCNRSIDEICQNLLPEVTKLAKDPHASDVLSKIFAYPKEHSIRDKAKQKETKSNAGQKEGHTLPDWLMRHKNDLAKALLPDVHVLAMDKEACWVIQEAVANVDNQVLFSLIGSLKNYLTQLINHMHANYVIQMILKSLPKECIKFMVTEIEKKVEEIAHNKCGCRAPQRLLERNDCKDLLDKILDKIMTMIDSFINHRYGNYVVQHILEWGNVQYQEEIFKVVLSRPVEYSMGQCSINVVEKCLKIAHEEKPGEAPNLKMQKLKGELIHKLIVGSQRDSSPISTMMDDGYGNCIVRRLIDWTRGDDRDILFKLLDKEMVRSGLTNNGSRVLEHYKKTKENIEKSLSEM